MASLMYISEEDRMQIVERLRREEGVCARVCICVFTGTGCRDMRKVSTCVYTGCVHIRCFLSCVDMYA